MPPLFPPLLAAVTLLASFTAQAQARQILQATPSATRTAPATGAPAHGLPAPMGLSSRFPAGLTAATLATPGSALTTGNPLPVTSGGAVVVPGTTVTPVPTNVMGAGSALGASQPASLGPGPYTVVEVARAFLLADANRDGELSPAEARRVLFAGFSFEELDRNHDGVITRWEFDDAMLR